MIKLHLILISLLVLLVALLTAGCTSNPDIEKPAEFYKGKSIELVSTTSPGNVYDLMCRIIAPYIQRDTGADVKVTSRRATGGMEGINYIYKAKPDGLTMGMITSTKFIGNKIMQEPAAQYEIEKLSYIMSIDRRLYSFFIAPDGKYQTIDDLIKGEKLIFGASSPSGSISLANLTVIKLLNLDARVITGFQGDSEISLAIKRGEVTGYTTVVTQPLTGSDILKPMFVLSTTRDPLMPQVPTITELINLTSENLALVNLWETVLSNSNILLTSPGVAENRMAFLYGLAQKWSQDEAFRKDIDTVCGEEVEMYLAGKEVSDLLLKKVSSLSQFQEMYAELMKKYRY